MCTGEDGQGARSATDGEAGFLERVRVGRTGRPTAARAELRGGQVGGEDGWRWVRMVGEGGWVVDQRGKEDQKIRRSEDRGPGDSREQRWSRGSGGWAGQIPNRACRHRWWSATSDKAALSAPQPGGVSLALPSDWAVCLQPRPEAARGTPIGSVHRGSRYGESRLSSVVGEGARGCQRLSEDAAARLGRDVMGLRW
jgi:hypothetical protein